MAKLCALMTVAMLGLHAETGRSAWLRYAALDETAQARYRQSMPAVVVSLG